MRELRWCDLWGEFCLRIYKYGACLLSPPDVAPALPVVE